MKRYLFLVVALVLAAVFVIFSYRQTRGMPDYAARTGEPCATCHVNPAGGGMLADRGRAWVAAGKPDKVPALAATPTPTPAPSPAPGEPKPTTPPPPPETEYGGCGYDK